MLARQIKIDTASMRSIFRYAPAVDSSISTWISHALTHRNSNSSCERTSISLAQRSFTNFALIGPPGSGKGTYGNIVSKKVDARIVSTGDLLRHEVANETEIGRKVVACKSVGALVNDELVGNLVYSYLQKEFIVNGLVPSESSSLSTAGYFMDGFPRTLSQAEMVTPSSSNEYESSTSPRWAEELRIHFAVSIEVPDKICLEKIIGRRKCSCCGKSFNVCDIDNVDGFFMPPIAACSCGPQHWQKREDDTEEIVARRLADFHAETAPVLCHYEKIGRLIRFVPYRGLQDISVLESLVQDKLDEQTTKSSNSF